MIHLFVDILGTALEMIILYNLQHTTKKSSDKMIFCVFACLTFLIVLMTNFSILPFIKVGFIFLYTCITLRACYKTSLKRITFCFVLYLLSIAIGEVISFGILRLLFNGTINSINANPIMLIIIPFSKVITILFIWYIKGFIKRAEKYLHKGVILTLTPIITCFLILFLQTFRLYYNVTISATERLFSFLSTICIIFSAGCIISLIEKYLLAKEVEQVTSLDIHQISSSYSYLSKKVESNEQVMELYHDLKNHLLILQSKDENSNYINGLLDKITDFELFTDTGNPILNTIIYEKRKLSYTQNIDFQSRIDMSRISSLKDFDICSIFGNALDNAIEACLKIDHGNVRKIIIFASKVRNFLIIRIHNSFLEKPNMLMSQITTSKSDPTLHGFGLKSIKRTVEKYNGEISIHYDQSMFSLNIAIPL